MGPASGRAVDVAGWRRPYRKTHAAPHDAFLMAPPIPFRERLLWLGSTGVAYSLPLYQIAGIYAPANGEFNTGVFRYPATGLYVNAKATWKGGTVTGGCGESHSALLRNLALTAGCAWLDEGCNAYIFAELIDASTGKALVGHTRAEAIPMMNVSGTKLPLRWCSADGSKLGKPPPCVPGTAGCPLAGAAVQLRLFFRDATVFAVGAL